MSEFDHEKQERQHREWLRNVVGCRMPTLVSPIISAAVEESDGKANEAELYKILHRALVEDM